MLNGHNGHHTTNGHGPGRPPVDDEPYTLAIDTDGIWTYNGAPLIHPKGLAMFKDHLRRAADGSYFVQFGPLVGPVEVADFPYVARFVEASDDGLRVVWNLPPGELVPPDRLFHAPDGTLAVRVKDGTLPAKFDRVSSTRLGVLLESGPDGDVWYHGPGGPVAITCSEP
jgi:hypothetical protein